MERNKVSLAEQLSEWKLNKNILDSGGELNGWAWNFYDWFCSDKSIEKRSKRLMPKVSKFIEYFNVDVHNTYVFFKNNCPCHGSLYDDFRICDMNTGDVLYTVTPRTGHYSAKPDEMAEIWGRSNDFDGPLYKGRNLSEIYKNIGN
jgi:hypothetical protein